MQTGIQVNALVYLFSCSEYGQTASPAADNGFPYPLNLHRDNFLGRLDHFRLQSPRR